MNIVTRTPVLINSGKGTANNPGDMTVIGNSTPRFQYGFNFNISYKGFDLGIMIQGIGKRDYAAINPYTYTLSASDPGWFPVFAGTTDYWKPLSTNSGSPDYYKAADSGAKLPRIYGSTIKGLSNASSNRLVNIDDMSSERGLSEGQEPFTVIFIP